MLPNVGMGELLVILVLALLLFGAKRLPELAKSVGKSMREFKKGLNMDEPVLSNETKSEAPEGSAPFNPQP